MNKEKLATSNYGQLSKASPPSYGQLTPQVVHIPPLILGPKPSSVTCPSCHSLVTSTVVIESSTKTHLFAALLCLLCFPLACVPYCVDTFKSRNHYCPSCRSYLGRFEN